MDERTEWEKIYDESGKIQAIPIPAALWLTEHLAHHPSSKSTAIEILDAGCGTGRNLFPLLQKIPSIHAVALDNAPTALEILREELSRQGLAQKVSIIEANIDTDLDSIGETFDIVISSLVIHHGYMDDVKRRVHKLQTKLSQGGYFIYAIASTLDPRAKTGIEIEPGTFLNTAQADGNLPHHYSTDSEIEAMFEGYDVVFKHLATPQMVTGNKNENAAHWNYVFKKL